MTLIKTKLKTNIQMFSVFEWFVLVLQCDSFVVIVFSDEPMQNQRQGLVDRKLVKGLQ